MLSEASNSVIFIPQTIGISYDAGGNVTSVGPSVLKSFNMDTEEGNGPQYSAMSVTPSVSIDFFNTNATLVVSVSGLSDNGTFTVSVYDASGQLTIMRESTSPSVQLSLGKTKSGVYIVDVRTSDGHTVRKITKE